MSRPVTATTIPATPPVFDRASFEAGRAAFDVGAFTIEARYKLEALSFLLSQVEPTSTADATVFSGLAWLLSDIRESLEETDDTDQGGA